MSLSNSFNTLPFCKVNTTIRIINFSSVFGNLNTLICLHTWGRNILIVSIKMYIYLVYWSPKLINKFQYKTKQRFNEKPFLVFSKLLSLSNVFAPILRRASINWILNTILLLSLYTTFLLENWIFSGMGRRANQLYPIILNQFQIILWECQEEMNSYFSENCKITVFNTYNQ